MLNNLKSEDNDFITEITSISYPDRIGKYAIINFNKEDKLTHEKLSGVIPYKICDEYDMINKESLFRRLSRIYVGRIPHSLYFRYKLNSKLFETVLYQEKDILYLRITTTDLITKVQKDDTKSLGTLNDTKCSTQKSLHEYIFKNVIYNLAK